MLASVLLSIISLLVEMVGLKCSTFMADEPQQKDKVALAGGVIFIIAGRFSYYTKAHKRDDVTPASLKQHDVLQRR